MHSKWKMDFFASCKFSPCWQIQNICKKQWWKWPLWYATNWKRSDRVLNVLHPQNTWLLSGLDLDQLEKVKWGVFSSGLICLVLLATFWHPPLKIALCQMKLGGTFLIPSEVLSSFSWINRKAKSMIYHFQSVVLTSGCTIQHGQPWLSWLKCLDYPK